MICLRCGYCCINYDVIIPKKGVLRIPKNPSIKDGDKYVEWKKSGVPCPHLTFKGKKANCAIHNLKVYKDCPCDRHGQIEAKKTNVCRMGEFVLSKGDDQWKKLILAENNKPIE